MSADLLIGHNLQFEPVVEPWRLAQVEVHYPDPQTVKLTVLNGEIDLTPDEAERLAETLRQQAGWVRAARGEGAS